MIRFETITSVKKVASPRTTVVGSFFSPRSFAGSNASRFAAQKASHSLAVSKS
jgi:hypothetical protein